VGTLEILSSRKKERSTMLIVAIIVLGLAAGWIAHLLVGRGTPDWPRLFVVGLAGSFVGGLLGGVLSGDGLALRPTGLLGSALGATLLLLVLRATGKDRKPTTGSTTKGRTRR
jgi:uncharacterized membrane protein YeaQ/YmgE (transglycosylase-associated protein family)